MRDTHRERERERERESESELHSNFYEAVPVHPFKPGKARAFRTFERFSEQKIHILLLLYEDYFPVARWKMSLRPCLSPFEEATSFIIVGERETPLSAGVYIRENFRVDISCDEFRVS